MPGGEERKLFRIADWDFNRQGRYNHVEPVRLPRGAVVRTTLTYDNSAVNPHNPSDLPVPVRWGEGSTDEMGAVGLSFVAADEANLAGYRGPALFGGGGAGAGAGGGMLANLTPERLAARFDLRDVDHDGKLKGDEIPARLAPFKRRLDGDGDGDGDGALTLAELQKLPPAARAGCPGAGGGAPPTP